MWRSFLTPVSFVTAAVALGLSLSCGDKKPPAPKPKQDAGAPRDAAAAPDGPTRSEYTPAQKKRYRRHLAAGRRLADAKKWGEATREFEKALEVIAMDGRARYR